MCRAGPARSALPSQRGAPRLARPFLIAAAVGPEAGVGQTAQMADRAVLVHPPPSLTAASRGKAADASERAHVAIHKVLDRRAEVIFRPAARLALVPVEFLYRHREHQALIAEPGNAPTTDLGDRPAPSDETTSKLPGRQLFERKVDKRLVAAHGELLEMGRRHPYGGLGQP
jgi:hypothetical protein